MKAFLKNYRQSPRKMRSVANLLRGKNISEARLILKTTTKRSVSPLQKLLESAISNAKHAHKIEAGELLIKSIHVNAGPAMKRFRPVSRGSAHPLKKRTSSVSIVLEKLLK